MLVFTISFATVGYAQFATVPPPGSREVAFERYGRTVTRALLDSADRILEIQNLGHDGQPTRRSVNVYDADGALVREVVTYFDDPEYDTIKEYTYGNGQLIALLSGNNRTGRWASEGYTYNERGDRTRTDHFRKSGRLAYVTNYALRYDDTGCLVEEVTTKELIPTDSLHADWENEVAIGDALVPTPTAAAAAKTTTRNTCDPEGRTLSSEIRDHEDRLVVRTQFRYDGSGHTERSEIYSDDGTGVAFVEEARYDLLGRMIGQTIDGKTTRNVYAGDSTFIVRQE